MHHDVSQQIPSCQWNSLFYSTMEMSDNGGTFNSCSVSPHSCGLD